MGASGDGGDDWRAGDVVFFEDSDKEFPWHVGIISDSAATGAAPKMLHLYPPVATEESIQRYLPLHSHFRWKATP